MKFKYLWHLLEGSLPCVNPKMFTQVTQCGEILCAPVCPAVEGFSRMDTLMGFQSVTDKLKINNLVNNNQTVS